MLITVTGSTGPIGFELVRLLSGRGMPVRAVHRTRRSQEPVSGVAWTRADLSDERLLEPALAGTTRLFLLSDNQAGFAGLQIRIIHAAQALGAAHVVKLSALGASDHSKSWIAREHRKVEAALEESSMGWTILRPHSFMQNWLGVLARSVRTDRLIESAIGDGRVPFIDTRDIAAVALEVLLAPEAHVKQKYVLTGPEAIGYADLAAIISEVTGKATGYRAISMDEERSRLEREGLHSDAIDALLAIAAYQKAGGPTAIVSDGVQRIAGRPGRTARDFVRDHAQEFR